MKTNQELLDEANKITFKIKADGVLNARLYNKYERGLYFIKNALRVHGMDKYQYGLVLDHYVDNKTKVPVICSIHGSFLQKPSNHTDSKQGCTKCSKHIQSPEEWIEKARRIHGNKYEYCNTNYKGTAQKVVIICPEHGPFLQGAGIHLQGKGCAKCSNNYQYDTKEWIKLAKETHGNRYNYSKAVYVNNITKLEIKCPEHGSFWQLPTSHISKFQGCPKCAGHNHDVLYLLKCTDTDWYKIGITTRDVKKRIRQLGGNLEDVFHVVCENPREHESLLHKLYEKDREYNPCVRNGNTEFFSLNEEQVAKVRQYMASIAIN